MQRSRMEGAGDAAWRARLATWGQDMRFALRTFRHAPGFVAAAVLTLALGIGATTAIFSVVSGVLLRQLPYPTPERVVQLWQVNRQGAQMQFSDPNFDDVRNRTHGFTGLAELESGQVVSVSGDVPATRAFMTLVSHDFFDVLGVHAILGRTFAPEEELVGGGSAPAVVVSWGFWQRIFDGRPDVLGKRLAIGDRTYTVVGVMQPELDFPIGTEIWGARELAPHFNRTAHNWLVIGRLRPGVPLDGAQRELNALARALADQYGSETMMAAAAVIPLREQLVGSMRPTLLVLLAASVMLLLIACANVANLLVARLTVRRGELALRMALGAARWRLVQLCLAESLALAGAGGLLGVGLAVVGTRALLALDPGRLPRAGDVRTDGVVLLFALGISLATAVGLALVTAWRATSGDIRETLSASQRTSSGAGSSTHTRRTLVVAQVAMTLVLLVSAGLLARSFAKLLSVDPGFRTEHAVVLDLAVEAQDTAAIARRAAFYRELLARLATVPGVSDVGAINSMPLAPAGTSSGTFLELTSPDERVAMADIPRLFQDHSRTGNAEFRLASAGYFAVLHIPVLAGRTFDDRDAPQAVHVAVVSASLAKAKWPGQSPIGRWIQFGNMDSDLRPFMIVGVVGDVREAGLDVAPKPTFYADINQRPIAANPINVVITGPASPSALSAAARGVVSALRPDIPPRVRTIESIVASSVAGRRFVLVLVGVFGGVALLLAALGLYSVISYLVAQRSRELSIRLALGATAHGIVRLVLQQGVGLAMGGIAVGAAAALLASRLLTGLLYGVGAADPIAFGGVVLLVAAVTLIACWVPAHRASAAAVTKVLRD